MIDDLAAALYLLQLINLLNILFSVLCLGFYNKGKRLVHAPSPSGTNSQGLFIDVSNPQALIVVLGKRGRHRLINQCHRSGPRQRGTSRCEAVPICGSAWFAGFSFCKLGISLYIKSRNKSRNERNKLNKLNKTFASGGIRTSDLPT